MYLVEKHNISKIHKNYNEIDNLSFLSKNLFNMSLYNIRQHYFNTKTFLSLKENYNLIKNIQKNDYESLPRKVSNQVIKQVDISFKSFFKALKEYNKNSKKFLGKPKICKYKDKINGRNILIYEKGAISKKQLVKGILHLSQTNIFLTTNINYSEIKEVRIIKNINSYQIEIVYEKIEKIIKTNNNFCAGDLGLNNLISLTFNGHKPFIFNGKPLKSINHYYNKKISFLKSELELKNKQKTSKKIKKLTEKRNNKINDYLHKVSRLLVNYLVSKDISKIVVGKNDGWKQDINIGKKNNQNFVQVPFNKLIQMIKYKSLLEGIELIEINEAYTSKCSFLDGEKIGKHETYKGKRIKRGLFRANDGRLINADINASYNIFKKAFPNILDGIQDLAVNPIKLNVL
jgi:putative transposase